MKRLIVAAAIPYLGFIRNVEAGVCEELKIPMDSVEIPGVGWVCKVRECANPTYTEWGREECIKCDQSGQTGDATKVGTEFCPLALGECSNGVCVPKADQSFFERNFGKPWRGLATFPAITVTHYGGSMASGGYPGFPTVDDVTVCMERVGIDGVAAVPPMMYGAGAAYGQACYKNNDLCYKLVGADGVIRTVALTDRCGGYVQAGGGANPMEDIETVYYFPEIEMAPGATVTIDANQCVLNAGCKIYTGAGQRCWYYTDGSIFEGRATCCQDTCGSYGPNGLREQVDWCGSSSHPHFDVPVHMLDELCDNGRGGGINAGSCALEWVEPIKCPLHPEMGQCCGGSCENCDHKNVGNCMESPEACAACGGVYCGGDDWFDICNSHSVPPLPPWWTTRPPDPPNGGGGPNDMTNKPPPPDDARSPTTWPGTPAPPGPSLPPAVTQPTVPGMSSSAASSVPVSPPGGESSSPAGASHPPIPGAPVPPPPAPGEPVTTPAPGVSTPPPAHQTTQTEAGAFAGGNGPTIGAVSGAAAGAAVLMASAAVAANRMNRPPEPLEAAFEGEEGMSGEMADREGAVQQESEDFAG
eukprot:Gregarina_sp_Poly_1__10579@NODE_787_length_6292_cov_18_529639_g576_i0_p2_GENE_NODE_787_length_6292_cov_18_529639_g576_i0NODE_787_length_6292_cov_18_529639_g576_i0_p2_ORF_typecomplete_len585_score85_11_NODE_787_length_6292_cov_18_529639_g576_i041225876